MFPLGHWPERVPLPPPPPPPRVHLGTIAYKEDTLLTKIQHPIKPGLCPTWSDTLEICFLYATGQKGFHPPPPEGPSRDHCLQRRHTPDQDTAPDQAWFVSDLVRHPGDMFPLGHWPERVPLPPHPPPPPEGPSRDHCLQRRHTPDQDTAPDQAWFVSDLVRHPGDMFPLGHWPERVPPPPPPEGPSRDHCLQRRHTPDQDTAPDQAWFVSDLVRHPGDMFPLGHWPERVPLPPPPPPPEAIYQFASN